MKSSRANELNHLSVVSGQVCSHLDVRMIKEIYNVLSKPTKIKYQKYLIILP